MINTTGKHKLFG